jgi:hypothetical protein
MKAMTVTRKALLVSLAVFVFVVGAAWIGSLGIFVYMSNFESGTPSNRESAIECTLEWGRRAPFPPSAKELSITIHGNAFTREFRTSFTAPQAEIERWLKESPGIRETSPTAPSPGIRNFQVRPGGGAQHAEVSIDDATNRVMIAVSWS